MKQDKNKNKGVSLYLSLIILSIIFSISLGLSALLMGQFKIIRGIENSIIAFYAADTGIEKTLYEFQCSYPLTELTNGATFQVEVRCNPDFLFCPEGCLSDEGCSAPRFCIKSKGVFRQTQRAIEVRY